MKSSNAQQLLDRIDDAVRNIDSIVNPSPIEQSYLAHFLVVLISGVYEEIIETVVAEMVLKVTTSPEVYNFAKNRLSKFFRNPSLAEICNWLNEFNTSWGATLMALPQTSRDAINSIVYNKNLFAHGNQGTCTLADIKRWYIDSRVVIEKVDDMLL